MKIRSISIFLICIFISHTIAAQSNFNDFKNLKAEGLIPDDFTTDAFHKITDDLQHGDLKLKGEEEKIFLEGVHYAINDLLHSGMVVYGDEVSAYVTEIVDKLLAKDENLRKKLRFYTIKTNETNAFSTYQGIIFVTTGLISQLTNEAQLAYILSHEIAHYTEEHVVQTFDLNQKNQRNSDKIARLSKFSKDNEFEADRLGIKLYYEAGYSKDELVSTFDVLLYAYLPFEEMEFSKSYLNSDLMTIPESFYPKTKFQIKAEEDTDDSKSSHPNIKKRKEAVENELVNYKDWGKNITALGEERFKNVRNTCRFESIRTDIIDAEFDDALYSIYILEKEYPNSIYLKRMKAKAWLGVAQYKHKGSLNRKLPSTKDLEGEIATLQSLLRSLSKNQAITVSMRLIEDLRKENPDDVMIREIWNRMVKTLGENEKYELIKFSKKTYEMAYNEFVLTNKDTLRFKDTINKENLSKYDKIKMQNKGAAGVFDSSAFYTYAISDLLDLKLFNEQFVVYQDEFEKDKAEEEHYEKLTSQQKRKYREKLEKDKEDVSLNAFIYLEPIVLSYNKYGIDRIKSEKLQIHYSDAVIALAQDLNMNVTVVSSSNLINEGTAMFNERSVLMSYFSEITDNHEIEVFPTDFALLQEIKEKNGTDKLMLSFLEHEKINKINPFTVATSVLVYPILLYYVPSNMLKSNTIYYTTLILDLDEGKIENRFYTKCYESINKFTISARVYNLLQTIK